MGRGNICVTGEYEGLFYIDNDYLHVYHRNCDDMSDFESECEFRYLGELGTEDMSSGEWSFSQMDSEEELNGILEHLASKMKQRFKRFRNADYWIDDKRVFLENELFCLCVADNEWSAAVILLQKDHWNRNVQHLHGRYYQTYLDAIQRILLEIVPEICTYAGPWTHGVIKREVAV